MTHSLDGDAASGVVPTLASTQCGGGRGVGEAAGPQATAVEGRVRGMAMWERLDWSGQAMSHDSDA